MRPEFIPLGVMAVAVVFGVIKFVLWLIRGPRRRRELKASREQWWTNHHAESTKFDRACAEFDAEVSSRYEIPAGTAPPYVSTSPYEYTRIWL